MKTAVRILTVGLFAIMLTAAGTMTALGQTCDQATKEKIYNTYLENYAGNLDQRKVALNAAREYIKLCETDEFSAEIVAYMKGAIPELEKWIKAEEDRLAKEAALAAERARLNRFHKAYTADNKNWDEIFAAGEDVLKHKPELLDMRILLASVSAELPEGDPPVNKYNDKILSYAKDSIRRLENGEKCDKCGAYNYEWKSKENALGWLHYTIGYIKYYPEQKTDEGVEYFYKATKYDSGTKKFALTYTRIADWYVAKAAELGKIRIEQYPVDESVGDVEIQKANIQKALEYIALEKGYIQRAIDALARAYNIAKADKNATESYRKGLYDKIKSLFEFRYTEEVDLDKKSEASINSYIAAIDASDIANPASKVEPIDPPKKVEEEATDADTSTTDGGNADSKATGERSRTVGGTTKKTGN